jgi:hypothetical protein
MNLHNSCFLMNLTKIYKKNKILFHRILIYIYNMYIINYLFILGFFMSIF